MTILYDARCNFCRRSKRIGEALDWLRLTKWIPNHAAQGSIVVERAGERLMYWRAVKAIALRLPLVWLLVVPAVALLPVFNPIGDRLYRWIAANRYRWGSVDSCDLQ
jgi:predicted DCC family thiol-disulfide oxidoreductase YuxK